LRRATCLCVLRAVFKQKTKKEPETGSLKSGKINKMEIKRIDPRGLLANPNRLRRSKSNPQADSLLMASIAAVGIVQPPIVYDGGEGGNGFVINAGHRRVAQAIAAGLTEIDVIVRNKSDAANDNADAGSDESSDEGKDAMRAFAENIAREPLNPVDQWRAIERLVALGWTEHTIAIALALAVRQIRKLRLLANILPAILDQMAKGDMPSEQQLRTIAAAAQDEQSQVWKRFKPKKSEPAVIWHEVARALSKRRMEAQYAKFGDDLAQAYGISWEEDLFAQGDGDNRFTTAVEAFFGAQMEWLSANLPYRGRVIECDQWGQPKLPAKAERVYGKENKTDHTGWYLNERTGEVQSVNFRMAADKSGKASAKGDGKNDDEANSVAAPARADVTQKGMRIIGDLRTDALHEALARAPIEDDELMALLVLSFAGSNVTIASATPNAGYGFAKCESAAVQLILADGSINLDQTVLRQAARSVLVNVLSCRDNRSKSGIVARLAGDMIAAGQYLPTMANDEFLSCLSRAALEKTAATHQVATQKKLKDTRSAVVKRFAEERFVHPAAEFAPAPEEIAAWAANAARQVQLGQSELSDSGDETTVETGDMNADEAGEYFDEETADETVKDGGDEEFENDTVHIDDDKSELDPADQSSDDGVNDGYAIAAE
jgi:ParB family transcriptional regulator, chromosome partitioning protein